MNLFDHMSEDLTVMMIELDALPAQPTVTKLIQALGRAHARACKASEVERAAAAAPRRQAGVAV